jgi:hypothetical protein
VLVVASFSDWDGHRVIGVFGSRKKALSRIRDSGLNLSSVTLSLDIIDKDKISLCQELSYGEEKETTDNDIIVRKHLYESA